MFVYDSSRIPEKLSLRLAEGGEGSVWTLENPKLSEVVVKLFHSSKLQEPRFSCWMEEKIHGLSKYKISDDSMAWPLVTLYSDGGGFIGFAMRKVQGEALFRVMHPMTSKTICKDWSRENYVCVCLDLVRKIGILHRNRIILGDMNPFNFLVNISTHSVQFIDIDSYQVSQNGKTFRCVVGRPEYTPPEFQGMDFSTFDRTREADDFATAVLLFQILMRGRHPFDVVDGETPAENIRKGNFPYGTNQANLIPKGNWIRLWSQLPRRMKDLFHRAFIEGMRDPLKRPSVDDWYEALKAYNWGARKGYHNMSMEPESFKSQEYLGKKVLKSTN